MILQQKMAKLSQNVKTVTKSAVKPLLSQKFIPSPLVPLSSYQQKNLLPPPPLPPHPSPPCSPSPPHL